MITSNKVEATSLKVEERDKLFKQIEVEVRGHDPAVLRAYLTFVKYTTSLLKIERSRLYCGFPDNKYYLKWTLWANRDKFAKKKYKVHYETRTYRFTMKLFYLTGSTASTFLEYIQRNIPEGVAMIVTYTEMSFFTRFDKDPPR